MIQVLEGRFLLDQVVQDILGINAPIRFPGWTINYTDYVILPAVPQISDSPQSIESVSSSCFDGLNPERFWSEESD